MLRIINLNNPHGNYNFFYENNYQKCYKYIFRNDINEKNSINNTLWKA